MATSSNRNGKASPVTSEDPALPAPAPVVDQGRLPQHAIPEKSTGRIRRRYGWAKLPAPYAEDGMEVLIWENYPQDEWTKLTGGDEDRRLDALLRMVLEHRMLGENGLLVPWSDDDGEIPQPSVVVMTSTSRLDDSPGVASGTMIDVHKRDLPFWTRCPSDIGIWIIQELKRLGTTLPNWMTATSTSTPST